MGSKIIRKRKDEENSEQQQAGNVNFKDAVAAQVEEVVGRTGMRGEVTQVRCKILSGEDHDRAFFAFLSPPRFSNFYATGRCPLLSGTTRTSKWVLHGGSETSEARLFPKVRINIAFF